MDERSAAWPWVAGLAGGLAVLALLVGAYAIGYNRGEDKGKGATAPAAQKQKPAGTTQGGGKKRTIPTGPGKQLFAQTCGSCHTLGAAGTSGKVGPNLDQLRPDVTRVLAAIKNGGTGSGAMPPNLVSGPKAQQIAEFVASAAGR